MAPGILTVAVASVAFAGSAAAQPAPSGFKAEYRLSPAEIEAVLAEAAKRRAEAVQPPARPAPVDARGEVGVALGTDGSRSFYGTGEISFGGTSGSAVSVDAEERPER